MRNWSVRASTSSPAGPAKDGVASSGRPSPAECCRLRSLLCGPRSAGMLSRLLSLWGVERCVHLLPGPGHLWSPWRRVVLRRGQDRSDRTAAHVATTSAVVAASVASRLPRRVAARLIHVLATEKNKDHGRDSSTCVYPGVLVAARDSGVEVTNASTPQKFRLLRAVSQEPPPTLVMAKRHEQVSCNTQPRARHCAVTKGKDAIVKNRLVRSCEHVCLERRDRRQGRHGRAANRIESTLSRGQCVRISKKLFRGSVRPQRDSGAEY